MKWLHGAIKDGKTGQYSSKRLISVMAAAAMSFAVCVLAIAALKGRDVSGSLVAVCGPLAVLAGANYVGGKFMEGRDVQSVQPRPSVRDEVQPVCSGSAGKE